MRTLYLSQPNLISPKTQWLDYHFFIQGLLSIPNFFLDYTLEYYPFGLSNKLYLDIKARH